MTEPPGTGEWPGPSRAELPQVAGYEVLEELGRSGMGVVYKARQVASGRLVALKLIRDGALASAEALGRFRIEAEAAARMRHRHIVEVFEVGERSGRPYFAMELVEGGRSFAPGHTRIARPATRVSSSRFAPPAAWTAMPCKSAKT